MTCQIICQQQQDRVEFNMPRETKDGTQPLVETRTVSARERRVEQLSGTISKLAGVGQKLEQVGNSITDGMADNIAQEDSNDFNLYMNQLDVEAQDEKVTSAELKAKASAYLEENQKDLGGRGGARYEESFSNQAERSLTAQYGKWDLRQVNIDKKTVITNTAVALDVGGLTMPTRNLTNQRDNFIGAGIDKMKAQNAVTNSQVVAFKNWYLANPELAKKAYAEQGASGIMDSMFKEVQGMDSFGNFDENLVRSAINTFEIAMNKGGGKGYDPNKGKYKSRAEKTTSDSKSGKLPSQAIAHEIESLSVQFMGLSSPSKSDYESHDKLMVTLSSLYNDTFTIEQSVLSKDDTAGTYQMFNSDTPYKTENGVRVIGKDFKQNVVKQKMTELETLLVDGRAEPEKRAESARQLYNLQANTGIKSPALKKYEDRYTGDDVFTSLQDVETAIAVQDIALTTNTSNNALMDTSIKGVLQSAVAQFKLKEGGDEVEFVNSLNAKVKQWKMVKNRKLEGNEKTMWTGAIQSVNDNWVNTMTSSSTVVALQNMFNAQGDQVDHTEAGMKTFSQDNLVTVKGEFGDLGSIGRSWNPFDSAGFNYQAVKLNYEAGGQLTAVDYSDGIQSILFKHNSTEGATRIDFDQLKVDSVFKMGKGGNEPAWIVRAKTDGGYIDLGTFNGNELMQAGSVNNEEFQAERKEKADKMKNFGRVVRIFSAIF